MVILLLTPCYFKSNFCLCEMGAAWAKSHKIYPVVVPPLSYADVKDVLASTLAAKIEDDIKYNELRDHLIQEVAFEAKTNTKWDVKRKAFLKKLPQLLANLEIPKEVSSEKHAALMAELEEAQSTLGEYEEETQRLKDYCTKLEGAKDQETVKKLKKDFKSTGIADEFEAIVDAISDLKSSVGGSEVLKFALADHYDKPYKINFSDYGDDFEQAARYNLVTTDPIDVNWNNRKMKELRRKLSSLDRLVEDNDRGLELHEYHADKYEDVPLEPDNQEFWEYHYSV